MSWVAELHDEPRAPALRLLPTTRADTIAFVVNGTIATNEATEFVRAAEAVLERNEHVRLLARIESPVAISPAGFKQSGMAAFKWRIRERIDRYAIVGGPRWLAAWVATLSMLTGIDIRHYDERDESAAWGGSTRSRPRLRLVGGPWSAADRSVIASRLVIAMSRPRGGSRMRR